MESTISDGNSAPAAPAPTSFAQAFAADASSASGTPAQSSTPAVAEAPSTDQGATPAAEDDRSPFIPRARFDEVLAERNAVKQWKEQYAWAESVNRAQLEQAVSLAQRYTGDRIGFLQELAKEVQDHPEDGPKLRSLAARTLAAARQQPAQPSGPDLSSISIDLGNGQTIALSDLKKEWLAEVRQEFAPVSRTIEQITKEKEQTQREQQIASFSTSTFEDVKTWPGMDSPENLKLVGEALKAMTIDGDDPREVALALNAAYRKVILPTLGSKAQSKLLDNLQQKAAASNSVNPGAAASSAPKHYTSFSQLPADMWR